MFFPMQLPRPWRASSELELFQDALDIGAAGELAGIRYAWAQEHHFLEEYSHSSAPEVFLGALSQRTRSMRLGHGVTLMPPGYNHPARVAERIATLDLVSAGRAEWGTGESSSRLELEGFGVDYLEKRAQWAESTREAARMLSSEPYPGHRGKAFSMPPRNVVPKSVQKPHPPMWMACSNRDSVRLAARLGLGALTFAFMDANEASFWVNEYYSTFKRDCVPIGGTVNPRIAMLTGFMLHEDGATARARGAEGQQFFKWALASYFRTGVHTPGQTQLWADFQRAALEPMAGMSGIGSPDEVIAHFRAFEAAGIDQLILLAHCGCYARSHISESLELFGDAVIPEFSDRHEASLPAREAELAPFIDAALRRVSPTEPAVCLPVEAYPLLWAKRGVDPSTPFNRSLDGAPLWRFHVGGSSGDAR
jgi:alkanesulfonate monooxygenase SsuD/methylene tetrahydromethanopterin reductase-like flavin-dependent oxidoreductase (luciferase family)